MRALLIASVTCALTLLTPPSACTGEKVGYEIYAKGYFVKNTAPLTGNASFVMLDNKNAYDQIFGIGFVMGAKPKLVSEKLFENQIIVAAIKSGNTLWKYEVQKVHVDKKKLIVEYTAKGEASATAKYTVPLILAVPRSEYTEVVFVENGKEVGKLANKK